MVQSKDSFVEDLELTEAFLNDEDSQNLGYKPEELKKAYEEISKTHKFE